MNKISIPSAEDIQATLEISGHAKRRKTLRRWFWLAVLAVLAIGVGYFLYARSNNTQKPNYATAKIAKSDLIVTVTATGTVQPITQVDVGSELSGTIKIVGVVDNDLVKKGDELASLDVVRLSAQRDRAAAQLAAAEAKLLDAQSTAIQNELARKRQIKLRISGLSTDQELESAEASEARSKAGIAVAEADIKSAKADLLVVDTDLAKSKILSPIDGIVLKVSAKVGQTVAASLQAPVLFTLADDLANMQIEAAVDEADIGQVREGQEAQFSVDAFRDKQFNATVQRIAFAPDKTDGVVTYKTILAANNDELNLRPGMTTTARIVVNAVKNALVVPNEALRYTPPAAKRDGGFSITQIFMPRFPRNERPAKPISAADGSRNLWLLRNGAAVEVKVKTGLSDGKQTAVTGDDIKVGDAVILSAAAAP